VKSLVRGIAAGALAMLLSGCWPTPGAGPDRRSFNPFERTLTPETVRRLTEAFRAPLAEGAGPPVVSPTGLFVRTGESVTAFEPGTGVLRWSRPLIPYDLGYWINDPFIVGARNEVWASFSLPRSGGFLQSVVVIMDAETGADDGGFHELIGGLDAMRGTDMGLIERDLSEGRDLTSIGVQNFEGRPNWGGVAPEAAGGVLTLGERLLFVATGNQVQAYDTTTPCVPYGDYFQACPSEWARPLRGETTPVVIGNDATVYAGSADGRLHALRTDTGGIRWESDLGSPVTRAPALADGTLYVATTDGRLNAVPADGCRNFLCPATWTTAPGSEITVQPAVAGGVVFVGSADGSLKAFDAAGCGAATCPALWTANAAAPVTGGLAVYNGRLYAGTANALVSYGLPPS
jgi:outer membrane protein assembly factor BamB